MKMKAVLILLFVPFISHAEITKPSDSTAEPFPSSVRGIHMVQDSKLNAPDEFKKELLKNKAEIKLKGFIEKEDPYARFLLTLKKHSEQEIKEFKGTKNELDTHLKGSPDEIKFAFPFKKIESVKDESVIGYAAVGTFVESKGWTGGKEFFTDPKLGTCSYSINPILAVELDPETTQYNVNKKPSNFVIQGTYNTGFVYSLNWYTDTTWSNLDCANMTFDKEIMVKIIDLANKIDRSNSV